jgi:SH3 domain-containing protein
MIDRIRGHKKTEPAAGDFYAAQQIGRAQMDMDKPDGKRSFRLADFLAMGGLVGVAVLGYVVVQIGSPADVRTEQPQKYALSASGAEGGTGPGNAAGAASGSSSQQLAANAGTLTPEAAASAPPNAQSKPASLVANDVAYVQKRRAIIRSEPSDRGSLAGRAYKGTKLSVVSRSGKWVQVERGETKGWVSAKLIGPRLP